MEGGAPPDNYGQRRMVLIFPIGSNYVPVVIIKFEAETAAITITSTD
jgi:hypothetical protein